MKQKSIRACYDEIKQREIRELKDAVRYAGGEVHFGLDYCGDDGTGTDHPIVTCNFNGFNPHSADVRIMAVKLENDTLTILGEEMDASGCATWFDDAVEIKVSDIAYGEIDFITSAIPRRDSTKTLFGISKETYLLCETVSELSNMLYKDYYAYYGDSTEVSMAIVELAVCFEKRLDWQHNKDSLDYYAELCKFADDCRKRLNL